MRTVRFTITLLLFIFSSYSASAFEKEDMCPDNAAQCFLGAVDKGKFIIMIGNSAEINSLPPDNRSVDIYNGENVQEDPLDISNLEGEIILITGKLNEFGQITSGSVSEVADSATKMLIYMLYLNPVSTDTFVDDSKK